MRKLILALLAVHMTVSGAAQAPATPQGRGRGAQSQEAPPPAPPPGSPGTYKSGADLMAVLKKATETSPDMSTSAVSNTDQYRINVVRRGKAAGAIAHPGNTELHYIIEGSATVVTGGTIVRPTGGTSAAATIDNGVTRHVTKGDVIIIPPNTPHWYKEVEGSITYLEVRFVAPTK
jgi:mannose-6-phosphate isomerase-like protein (cupin superfamily)